jgi:hypothetical protein
MGEKHRQLLGSKPSITGKRFLAILFEIFQSELIDRLSVRANISAPLGGGMP